MQISCRSPQAIRDDTLVEVHTHITTSLNEVVNGVCLYRGAERARLTQLRAQVEAEILGEGQAPQLLWAHVHACTK